MAVIGAALSATLIVVAVVIVAAFFSLITRILFDIAYEIADSGGFWKGLREFAMWVFMPWKGMR